MKKGTNFLSLPIELRNIIYEYYLAMRDYIPALGEPIPNPAPWRKLEPMATCYISHYVRDWKAVPSEPIANARAVPANDKVPLLRVSKAVYADARPLLYLHHTFAFARGNWRFRQNGSNFSPTRGIDHQPLKWLTKVELTNNKRYFPSPYKDDEQAQVYRQLRVLKRHCPWLEHLLVELYLWFSPTRHPFDILSEFSDRLSYLEIRVQGWNWASGPASRDLTRIAPLRHWIDGRMKKVEGYTIYDSVPRPVHKIMQSTYILDRSSIAGKEGSRRAFERDGHHLQLFRYRDMSRQTREREI
ncbi:MAG: hypothetical protein OHK93_005313 [Ramalina farinacea]|uniref:Uncharacterized protein n=1 Tax=Ramalina farinacea TaxID=258253 RepID=A0AA43QZ13_9LECA|nr:hypothetical protein [Ramalina farinacea]